MNSGRRAAPRFDWFIPIDGDGAQIRHPQGGAPADLRVPARRRGECRGVGRRWGHYITGRRGGEGAAPGRNCSVLMRWMCLLQLTRGSTWTGDSASRPYYIRRGSRLIKSEMCLLQLTGGSTWMGGSTWTGDSASRPYYIRRGSRLIKSEMCLLQLTGGSTWMGGSTWTGDSASRPYLHTTGFPSHQV